MLAACGSRTELIAATETEGDGGLLPDGGVGRVCGAPPSAGIAGEYNATLCTDPTECDEFGGVQVCPCAGAASPSICGFEAIHDDGHVFTAQCDPSTGACACILDGNPCSCQGATMPSGVCTLGSPLNCCFTT
jgi:hypothetical protein